MSVQLGDSVKDRISGATGIVVGIASYLNDTNSAQVQPTLCSDGKPCAEFWISCDRLLLVARNPIPACLRAPPPPSQPAPANVRINEATQMPVPRG